MWVRRLSLAGAGLVVALTVYLFTRYPAVSSNGMIQLFTLFGAVVLTVYAFFAFRDTRRLDGEATKVSRYGVGCGLLVFLLFAANTFGGVLLDRGVPLPYFLVENGPAFLTTVGLVAVAGGILVSWRADKFAAGMLMGAWAALVAGIAIAVVLLATAAILAPISARDSKLAAEITFFANPFPLSDQESSTVADALIQAVFALVFVPIFTVIGSMLGEVLGLAMAGAGAVARNEARRARASTRLAIARGLIKRGHLSAAITELGIVLEHWLRSTVRMRSEGAARRAQPFSMDQALIDLRGARAVTRDDMDEIQQAIRVRDEVVDRGSTPSRDEVLRMLAVVQRLTRQNVGYVG